MAPIWPGMNGVNCKEWGAKCAFSSTIIMVTQKGSSLKTGHHGQVLASPGDSRALYSRVVHKIWFRHNNYLLCNFIKTKHLEVLFL